jgi:hypothetical protein
VRKGGFEPPRLTAPPPQDGASASSATSARGEVKKLCVARPWISRRIRNPPAYFDAGAVGTGAAGAGAGALDVLENCCNTELPVEAAVEF